jgi:hypothetical protein
MWWHCQWVLGSNFIIPAWNFGYIKTTADDNRCLIIASYETKFEVGMAVPNIVEEPPTLIYYYITKIQRTSTLPSSRWISFLLSQQNQL